MGQGVSEQRTGFLGSRTELSKTAPSDHIWLFKFNENEIKI